MHLQAKLLVSSSTIQVIVEEITGLIEICQKYTRNQLKEVLQDKANLSESNIDTVIKSLQETDLHSLCSPPFATTHSRCEYFKRKLSYVHSQTVYLGTDANRKERFAQYIPIK